VVVVLAATLAVPPAAGEPFLCGIEAAHGGVGPVSYTSASVGLAISLPSHPHWPTESGHDRLCE
jgi:lysozyme family protein